MRKWLSHEKNKLYVFDEKFFQLSIRMIITFISFNVGDLLGSQLTDFCTVVTGGKSFMC
jgi:hypothetical protein